MIDEPNKESASLEEQISALTEKVESLGKENEKLSSSNKELQEKILSINPNDLDKKEDKQARLKELKKSLSQCDPLHPSSNLDYVSKVIEYRKIAMELGEPDPFLGNNQSVMEVGDKEKAQKVADGLQYAIEKAEGSNAMFNGILSDLIAEDSLAVKNIISQHKEQMKKAK